MDGVLDNGVVDGPADVVNLDAERVLLVGVGKLLVEVRSGSLETVDYVPDFNKVPLRGVSEHYVRLVSSEGPTGGPDSYTLCV